ncbi:quinone-dependent dihydroorotate dehydrogenase [Brachybacterium sp. EF45031]|uniref:quinone-dependent dihydroorotate dehydrogenase n=1 Tax=Brachybacterium sillae TaxID=2810536 RepID=UPI00217D336A|nr:quinone-dependent dihydroorotate dehydrogenase [Brachybacterium sillae]MCS6710708.1 quinone-dependent dihydroorotate dehydrogenase [Brachybacterium sillae]
MLYRLLFSTVLRHLDPEKAHVLALDGLALAHRLPGVPTLLRRLTGTPAPVTTEPANRGPLGLTPASPVGLAAGMDKHAHLPLALLDLGFGHVEVGTLTARGQQGNPRPRAFRLVADRALINRMGFNNRGAEAAARELARVRATDRGRYANIGVNIGKTKTTPLEDAAADYRTSARLLAPYASYLAVNVSSPNTPGLRDLQSVDSLRPILEAVSAEAREAQRHTGRCVPVLVKIAPDLHDEDVLAVADLVLDLGLAGVIATNTTIARPENLRTPRAEVEAIGAGGLSGPILAERSRQVLLLLRERLGPTPVIISAGGIDSAEEAAARLRDGADLVQVYTSFIYEGPGWPGRLARALRHSRVGTAA